MASGTTKRGKSWGLRLNDRCGADNVMGPSANVASRKAAGKTVAGGVEGKKLLWTVWGGGAPK